jgi:hypothetical protein
MSETFAAQLTAVATLALAVLALVTAALAFLAWQKQSREVKDQADMLKLQAEEFTQLSADRQREAGERRRAQAVQLYMWMTIDSKDKVIAHVRNTSQQPVYDVRLWGMPETGGIKRTQPLMPDDEWSVRLAMPAPDALLLAWKGAFTFRDRAGIRWQTWADGRLEELPDSEAVL